MRQKAVISVRILVLALAFVGGALAQGSPKWTEPFPPFRIAGNLYYVGSRDLASYLVTTPQGNILINSGLEANVPMIKASIEKLGFKFSDTKVLLISQAHWDHDAGSAVIKEATGATYMVMDADVQDVESGGKTDSVYGMQASSLYTPTKVDRVLHDRSKVKLGGTVLVARLTPGHTKGCTTWTMKVAERPPPHRSDCGILKEARMSVSGKPSSRPSETPMAYTGFVHCVTGHPSWRGQS
jgi:metallo-beta-lactamase class B